MPDYILLNLDRLKTYKNIRTAIITDIDGTISEIVPKPDQASVTAERKEILKMLGGKFKLLAFITGRTIDNARQMIKLEGALYVGNHGMEYQKNNQTIVDPKTAIYQTEFKEIENELQCLLKISGILLENKKTSLTIHYRLTKNPKKARSTILNRIKDLNLSNNLITMEGRKIIEIKPQTGNNKGTIINKIVDEYQINQLIYCGDDKTDSDAFQAIKSLNEVNSFQGISVVVLSAETPDNLLENADYYVNNIEELFKFFKWLIK
jgi:trehalose 6-phosphate phosphatase